MIKDGGFLYFLGWCGYRLFFRIFYHIKAEGLEKIPKTGGFIIASNHVSTFDPPAIGSVLSRAIYYMAKKELFENPVFGWVLRRVNAFPVSRSGADFHAVKEAQKILEEGKTLLIFPQGGRRSLKFWESSPVKQGRRAPDNLSAVKSGVGMLSCRANVPVVPCAVLSPGSVQGAKGITVRFSDPVYPPPKCAKPEYDALSIDVAGRIQKLLGTAPN